MEHISVLLDEVVSFFDYLNKFDESIIADFTIGGGGHSEALLTTYPNIKIIGFDRDNFAINFAKNKLDRFKNRIKLINKNFSNFDEVLNLKLNGAILDLGISNFHIEDLNRGFSFNSEALLDMRMSRDDTFTAYNVVNEYDFLELQRIFKDFGEVKMPNRVIKAIIKYRKDKPIETCKELADIIVKSYGYRGKIHPATKFFQAIRIEVNNELENLKTFLSKIIDYLEKGSRLQIISFHSLEDRIVKNFFRNCEYLEVVTKKPVTASKEEREKNPKSRSAKLRVAEKL